MDASMVMTVALAVLLVGLTAVPYVLRHRAAERRARGRLATLAGTEASVVPILHPRIDALKCIGCGSCIKACPEGDVIGLIEGKATLIHASKCVGHGLCAQECPVGGIALVMGAPGRSAEMPILDDGLQTSVPGVYIAGELGGLGLIRNALTQGIRAAGQIASSHSQRDSRSDLLDVVIVGAGPAGLGAALAAMQHGLRYAVLEQEDIGGTILQYPRRKIVMTAPVDLPIYGRLKITETSKESLLETWRTIIARTGVQISTGERVMDIQRTNGHLSVTTSRGTHHASHVILCLGRRGTPRKLGVPGEQLAKVAYRLIEAESFKDCDVLVVGGGDSAVEAAVGLAAQRTNRVALSYRKAVFSRIKERNQKRLDEEVKRKRIRVLLSSEVREIRERTVVLECGGQTLELPNDYVFIFAGGELPYDLLRKIGIAFHSEKLE